MNHYLREIINCMNYNTVLSQVFFFLLLGFHAHVREVSKVSHLYFYPGGKSSVRCPLKPSDSIPLCPNNPAH